MPRRSPGQSDILSPGPTPLPRRRRSAPVVTDDCLPSTVDYPPCNDVGNNFRSCYPTDDTVIVQDTWTQFIWNINLPQFTQFNLVDVYLFHQDSGIQVQNWTDIATGQGSVTSCVGDLWLGTQGLNYSGKNLSWPFYYVVVSSGTVLNGAEPREPTFHVLQDAPLNSVVSASRSSASVASASSAVMSSAIPSSLGSLQGNDDVAVQSIFPHWAIALLAVLGFLSFLGIILVSYLLLRDLRSRRRRRWERQNRESIGSESPMMAAISDAVSPPQSPSQHQGTAGSFSGANRSIKGGHDRSSTTSRANSAGDSGPFSGAEAALMADAFRNALRKPDFADRPVEEGESPDAPPKDADSEQLLSRELAQEGRDLRSVSSERGVRVETADPSAESEI